MFWKSPLTEVVGVVDWCSVVVFVGDWVGGSRQLGLGERVLVMEIGVGVGLGMPEFAVQLCFGNPLWQKFLCWWMGVLLLCLWVIG